jgi:nickel transport protein
MTRVLLLFLLFVVVPSTALAHGLALTAKVQEEMVRVEVFFEDDTSASDAKVTVTTDDGHLLAEGKTDAIGLWSFPKPSQGSYRIEANAGDGHIAKGSLQIASSPTTDSATRDDLTRTPWLRIVVGLTTIGLITLFFMRRGRVSSSGHSGAS